MRDVAIDFEGMWWACQFVSLQKARWRAVSYKAGFVGCTHAAMRQHKGHSLLYLYYSQAEGLVCSGQSYGANSPVKKHRRRVWIRSRLSSPRQGHRDKSARLCIVPPCITSRRITSQRTTSHCTYRWAPLFTKVNGNQLHVDGMSASLAPGLIRTQRCRLGEMGRWRLSRHA